VAAVCVLIVGLSAAPQADGQSTIPVRYSTRAIAMGGANLLSANPIEAGYFNPGALSLTGGFHLYVPMVQVSANRTLLDMVDYIDENENRFDNFDTLPLTQQIAFVNEINNEFNRQWVAVNVDPMVGLQMGSFALSAYSVTRANLRLVADLAPIPTDPPPDPEIQGYAINDIVLNAGLGLQFGPFLHGGVGVRYLNRRVTDDPNGYVVLSSDETEFSDLLGGVDGEDQTINGFAVDVGGALTLSKAFAVGGVIRGIVSSMEDEDWEPEISGGVMIRPLEVLMGIPKILIRDLTLEANISDLTNVRGEEYKDKLQIGAEVKIPLFSLRAGLNRGKLSYGAGLHLLIIDVAAAVATVPVITPTGIVDDEIFVVSVGLGW